MRAEVVEALAAALLAARSGGARVPPGAADMISITADEAYAVQRLVSAGLGPVAGFKFAHRPGQAAIMAPIQAADIVPSPARVTSDEPVGIELEVGFRLLAAPPRPESRDFRDRLRATVAPVAAIEVVRTRLADLDAAPPHVRLADHQLNGGLVVGSGPSDWSGSPMTSVEARLTFDGQVVLEGPVRLPFGEAFECLAALAEMVGAHCGGLRSGHVVITGSLNGLPWVDPGTRIHGRIAGIGDAAVEITR